MTERPQVVILGAGQPFAGTEPSALVQTSGERRVLDWILDAFESTLDDPEVHFVGGYRLGDIVEEYPNIHFSRNEDWESSGTVASLCTAPISSDRPVYVCYADTVFEPGVVSTLAEAGGTAVGVDGSWQTRYQSRSAASLERAEKVAVSEGRVTDIGSDLAVELADAEFSGLVRLSPDAVAQTLALWEGRTISPEANLPTLVRALAATDFEVGAVDIGDRWAELETAADLSRFVLDTKANTLRRLQSMVTESTILEQYTFTVESWREDEAAVREGIATAFDADSVIIRSSALTEDGWEESNAGHFESVLDVPVEDPAALGGAIETVIRSYGTDVGENQVLVQPMIANVDQSGVVMTRSLEGNSPYYVINYDATTASTESVTDGTGQHLQTTVVRKDVASDGIEVPNGGVTAVSDEETGPQFPTDLALSALLRAVRELEELIAHDALDVEFAIDEAGTVYVLQARPMTIDPAEQSVDDQELFATVEAARGEFREATSPSPYVFGDRALFGVMPDWNPAEIIGRQPRQLAASLYRYLVMDETWATQRAEYGYRDVRPEPLMKQFAGQPYVDVRADFNSFIPASVPDELAARLVEYYLDRLESNPELHDKVEFEVAITCLAFDFDEQIQPLREAGFTREELDPFREGLAGITRGAFERIDDDYAAIERLVDRYESVLTAELSPLQRAYYLLADCRRLGTLPFAHLARSAFVATSLLRSLERTGVITAADQSEFQQTLDTVARQFERDAARVAEGTLDWGEFLAEYGHLRPGTYDITSPRYSEAPEEYLEPIVDSAGDPERPPAPESVWDAETRRAVERELESIGLPDDVDAFLRFLADAIEGREYAKFVFSRNLSEALECIAAFGATHGVSREELSYVPIEEFFELTVDHPPSDVDEWLATRIREGRDRHAITKAVELPPLLFEERDFLVFERPAREPNFVTDETVSADVVELTGDGDPGDLTGNIVMIPQADPGYDWLFGHDIAGLVTMYGGANSHMAVRAAEFSLPAAIGVGENRYEQLRRAEVLELDCVGRTTRVIR